MKATIFSFFLLAFAALGAEPLKVKVSAKSAILINAETGAILYEKNAHERVFPASLTKVATCLYAIKKNKKSFDAIVSCPQQYLRKMNKSVKVAHSYRDPAYFLEPDGTHYWIKGGEELSFRDLLYGMMLVSGNDAANYVANYIGGSIPKFMKGMNAYLKEIGCKDTHFENPHGLHHPKHYTTAYDLALITKEALKEDEMRSIVTAKEYERAQTNLQTAKKITNQNQLLQPGKFFYPRAIGMKTGYHSDAGYTYASVARDGDRTLIAILLDYKDFHQRFRDAICLFEAAFAEEKEERLLFRKEENIFSRELKHGKEQLKAALTEDIAISYFPAEEPEIMIELNWEHKTAPIKMGSYVGAIKILDQRGQVIKSSPLIAAKDVDRAFIALIADAALGKWDCPKSIQWVLILLLSSSVLLSLYYLFLVEGRKKS